MTTLREKALGLFVAARTEIIDQKAGLRRYTVYVRRKVPSDGRMGLGAGLTLTDTAIAEKPRVRQASQQDVVASGGKIEIADFILDRITPRNDANTLGISLASLTVAPTTAGEQVFIVLDGPSMPAYVAGPPPSGGGEFTLVDVDPTRNFGFRLVIRPATGRR